MDPNHSSKLASNPFCLGFPGFFPRPFGRLSSANHFHQPTRSSSKLHRLARSMPRSRVKHFSVDGVEPEERQEQWFSLRIIEDLARMVQYMPKQRGNCLCQMESKHYHQVLCKLPDKVQLLFFFGSLLLGSSPGRSALQSAE